MGIRNGGVILIRRAMGQTQKGEECCLRLLQRKLLQAACGLHESSESPRKARQVLIVFHRIECRMENLPIEHLEIGSQKYHDLKADLSRTERHILKEMGFVCHVEHHHKFISNYLAILETPPELRQEAWNLANDRYFLQIN
ncbi:hypothetical protein SO802_005402 [Lithocarpus litseifolius]|uniref:Uncharacterized protein n=1 Tax=Lithocarpus litseifolius TaxID=425828 RepID=A0AAW2DJL3_9ROSI